MDWLNFHHLKYFYVMAKAGSLRKAAELLGISQPSISHQIHLLEDALQTELFRKSGRKLVLTETGRMVYHYAEEIFELGSDLIRAVKSDHHVQRIPFHVGLTNTLPKSVASDILRTVLKIPEKFKIVCQEDDIEDQLGRLASHRLDLLLTDEPAPSSIKVKVFNHFLGSTPVVICANKEDVGMLKDHFPSSLNDMEMFLPSAHSPLRRKLDQWFQENGVHPQVIGEFDDPALMMTLAREQKVCFPAPEVAMTEIRYRYGFESVTVLSKCTCEFYAITSERQLKHPAIQAVNALAPQVFTKTVN